MVTSPRLTVAYALASATGFSTALAQNTRITFSASLDCASGAWSDRVEALPGQTVYVQMRIAIANLGTQSVFAFAGLTLQPTLSTWRDGDAVLPWTDPPFPSTDDGCFRGTLFPFPSRPPGTSSSAAGEFTAHVDPGGTLRFAGANAVTLTTNLAWGLSVGQVPQIISNTNFRTDTDFVAFRYAVTLSTSETTPRDLLAAAPLAGVLQQRATWYRTSSGAGNLLTPILAEDIIPATIHVIPAAPTSLALAGASLLASRRRRL